MNLISGPLSGVDLKINISKCGVGPTPKYGLLSGLLFPFLVLPLLPNLVLGTIGGTTLGLLSRRMDRFPISGLGIWRLGVDR
jgi:hypothetical protein